MEPAGNFSGRIDDLLLGPKARQGVQPVGDGLAEGDQVRLDAVVLDRPHLAGAEHAHVDFVADEQYAVVVQHRLQFLEEVHRRDDVAAGALNGLGVEGGVFALAGLGVPQAVVFGLEQPREAFDDGGGVLLLLHAAAVPEAVGELHEQGLLAEMAVAAAIAVGGGDGRGAQGAAVIAPLEGEHQALAAGGVADDFERVLDRLGAADVEVDPARLAELLLDVAGDHGRQLDLVLVQILRGDLRHGVEGLAHHGVQARVAIAEVGHRVPHLQIQVGRPLPVVHVGAFAAGEDRRVLHVMHRVAVGADLGLQRPQALLFLAGGDHARSFESFGRRGERGGVKWRQEKRPSVRAGDQGGGLRYTPLWRF